MPYETVQNSTRFNGRIKKSTFLPFLVRVLASIVIKRVFKCCDPLIHYPIMLFLTSSFFFFYPFWPLNLHEASSRGYFLPLTAPRTAVIFFTSLGQWIHGPSKPLPNRCHFSTTVILAERTVAVTAAAFAVVCAAVVTTFHFQELKRFHFVLVIIYICLDSL